MNVGGKALISIVVLFFSFRSSNALLLIRNPTRIVECYVFLLLHPLLDSASTSFFSLNHSTLIIILLSVTVYYGIAIRPGTPR